MNQEVLHEEVENNQSLQEVMHTNPTIEPTGLMVGLMVGGKDLTERDSRLLLALRKHVALTAFQIKKLLGFPTLDRAQRRCLALLRKGLLYRLPYFSTVPGRAEYCYILSRDGLQCIQSNAGHQPIRLKSSPHLNHLLAINDFWICLERACRNHDCIRLEGFIPEFWHTGQKGKKATQSKIADLKTKEQFMLIPDAAFCLSNAGAKKLFFLEIDRATGKVQSSGYRSFKEQVQKYIVYQKEKEFGKYRKIFRHPFTGFQVLYVTVSESRIKAYQQSLSALKNIRIFVLLTTFDKISSENILCKIWKPSKCEDGNVYSMLE